MKKSIIFILLALIIFSISSCVEPIPIELPPHEPKLVVSSQVIPGQVMLVSVSRTFSVFQNVRDSGEYDTTTINSLIVEHARVTIEHGGRTDTLFGIGGGIYVSILELEVPGENFILHVYDSVSGQEVRAHSQILPAVGFKTIAPEIERHNADTSTYLNFTIQDPPQTRNWYLITYTPVSNRADTLFSLHEILGGMNTSNTDLVSDLEFTNGLYSQRRSLPFHYTDTIVATISNISEDYFKFLKARQKSGSLFNMITGEPINYPSNVQGGYGFFNTHNPRPYVFDLNDY